MARRQEPAMSAARKVNIRPGVSVLSVLRHLTDIYRVFLRDGTLELRFNGESLSYEEPHVLTAPFFREPNGPDKVWRKEIEFEFGHGLSVKGFAALRDPGNFARSGFALFRRGRLIQGSGEDGYRPPLLFGTSGSSSYARLRLLGELHLEGFEVSHTKDGFRWDENEEPFLELLKEYLETIAGGMLATLVVLASHNSLHGPVPASRPSGWAKAIWVIGILVFPYLGVLAYLITQRRGMAERNNQQIQQARDDLRKVVGYSAADEIEKLDRLKKAGTITDAEFSRLRAKLMQ